MLAGTFQVAVGASVREGGVRIGLCLPDSPSFPNCG